MKAREYKQSKEAPAEVAYDTHTLAAARRAAAVGHRTVGAPGFVPNDRALPIHVIPLVHERAAS